MGQGRQGKVPIPPIREGPLAIIYPNRQTAVTSNDDEDAGSGMCRVKCLVEVSVAQDRQCAFQRNATSTRLTS